MEDTNKTIQPQPPEVPIIPTPLISRILPIALIFLLLSLSFSGFLLYQNLQLQQEIASLKVQPTPTPSPDPQTKPDLAPPDTANWKTYKNSKYPFSFKYPTNYTMEENSGYISILSPLLPVTGKGYELKNGELKVEIYIQSSPVDDSLEKYVAEKKAQTKENLPESNILEETEVVFHGVRTVLLKWEAMGTGETRYLIKSGYRIGITKYPLETSRQFEFDQILSTFKFSTSQINESCPLGLSPLKNDFFSICYPNTMSSKETIYTPTDRQTQAVMTRFENPDERIAVTTAFLGGWGGGYSLSKTTVADYPTEILTFKNTEGKIVNLVAVIDNGVSQGQFPIAIDYQQKSETHFLDQEVFNNVINSFRLK